MQLAAEWLTQPAWMGRKAESRSSQGVIREHLTILHVKLGLNEEVHAVLQTWHQTECMEVMQACRT